MVRRSGLRGSNLTRVGSYNQALVLDAVRRAKSISRVEIAELTDLTPQTVTNICRRLIGAGIICETGKIPTALGKPRTALGLAPRGLAAVGVQFDPAASCVVVLDLVGELLVRRDFSPPVSDTPERVVEVMAREIHAAVREAGVPRDRVLGVGVGSPGPVDIANGTLNAPPNLPGWTRVPLRDLLRDACGLDTVLDKDVTAAAAADAWYAGDGTRRSAAVVYIGTGIGVGAYVGREIIRGSSGNAGEIGHIVVVPDGPPCCCGARGCVAVASAPNALAERFAPGLGVLAGVGELRRRWGTDADVRRAVEIGADGLERLAGVVVRLYDVERVVFGGPMWQLYADVLPAERLERLGEKLSHETVHRVEVLGSPHALDLGGVGAACLVFDHTLGPTTARLMAPDGAIGGAAPRRSV